MTPSSYLICGTPRTGSTLLCSLLTSTGVAGRPESYFREPDLNRWAREFGVRIAPDGTFGYKAFVDGAVRAGSTPNGVFAGRIMWGTMQLVTEGIGARTRSSSDLALLEETFGPLKLIHHRREDVVDAGSSGSGLALMHSCRPDPRGPWRFDRGVRCDVRIAPVGATSSATKPAFPCVAVRSDRILRVTTRRWATVAAGVLGMLVAGRRRRRRDVHVEEVPAGPRPIEPVGTTTAGRTAPADDESPGDPRQSSSA